MKPTTISSIFTWTLLLCAVVSNAEQHPQLINIQNRTTTSLNGRWNHLVDQYENGYYNYRWQPFDEVAGYEKNKGAFYADYTPDNTWELIEYNYDAAPLINVPGSWNYQDPSYLIYEGTIWYRKKFDYSKKEANNRVFLHFGAVNYEADVYLNGRKLGKHVGGFTPFNFEITEFLKEKGNSLVVKVDNKRKQDAVPTVNTDWFNYGGITREVTLVEEPATFIRDYMIQLKKGSTTEVEGFAQLDGAQSPQNVQVEIPELNVRQTVQTDANGRAALQFKLNKATLWSPENPKRYKVKLMAGKSELSDLIGFRSIETKGADILLNGKSIFLRGISIHEEIGSRNDRAWSAEDARLLLNRAKELNCNFVRLAHYPHNENMIRMADELGLMVWSEIPVYWTISWENAETYKNAEAQLTDMITRDKNRACVIIWSVANETPVSDARTTFLTNLISKTRSLDATRFVSAALEKHTVSEEPLKVSIEDPFAALVDVLSFNQYLGWYDGLPEKCNRANWHIAFEKPVIISEFGGGALAGKHGDKSERWTEEFQEDLYVQNLAMLSKIPQFRGTTPWILNDFRSPRRQLPQIQDGWNRKGVFSETGQKKKAFYVLRDFYIEKELQYK